LIPVGVDPVVPIAMPLVTMLRARTSVRGWGSGTAKDAEDTAKFSAQVIHSSLHLVLLLLTYL
jgi:hypothetical protein